MNTFTLEGTLLSPSGNAPLVGVYVYFRVLSAGTDTEIDAVFPRQTFSVGPTDASGILPSTEVWINGDSGVQSYYEILVPGNERVEVVIPSTVDGTTVRLDDILELYRVTSSTQQSTVLAQAIDRANHIGGPDDMNGVKIILSPDGLDSISNAVNGTFVLELGGVNVLSLTAAKAGILDGISAVTPTDSVFLVGNGTDFVGEAGVTAQTSLGVLTASGGGKIGVGSASTTGGAFGLFTSATTGGAVGAGAFATDGFAGGASALAPGAGSAQLGAGTNATANTIQFRASGSVTASQFGKLAATVTSVTATTYTGLTTDKWIEVDDDTAGAVVTVTLPAAATVGSGFELHIKKLGTTANVVIDGNGTETIDGGETATLTIQYESLYLVSNGTGWGIY